MLMLFLVIISQKPARAQTEAEISSVKSVIMRTKVFLESEFQVRIDLDFKPTGMCLAEAGGNEITFCDYFIKKLIKTYGLQKSTSIAIFTLYHEAGHIVFDPSLEGINYQEVSALTAIDVPWLRQFDYHIQHENLDTLAAKLFKEQKIPHPNAIEEFIRDTVEFAAESNPLSLSEVKVFTKIQRSRAEQFAFAFREGWSNWKGYNKLWNLCGDYTNEGFLFDYVMKKATSPEAMKLSVGSQICVAFPTTTLAKTFRQYFQNIR